MSSITVRKGQRGKVIRIKTGYDLAGTTARTVRLSQADLPVRTISDVPFDPASPGDMLWTIQAGQLDLAGTVSVEVEIRDQSGSRVLKHDGELAIEVTEIGETI